MDNTVLLVLAAIIYFLPAANAYSRKHRSAGAILFVNIVLGWTVLGWLLALIWSATGNVEAVANGGATPETHVRCPDCRELVLREARKCKHCGCALIPQ